ncbi:hypothetical protein [Streptomyces sp. ISL-11]|uniref:hypothetical protein n=1 Tax=Streptomyces sp. ISL-11 TaxID=2819174 RepID=UPI001BE906AC|nr:hypothetical protein [Streptomyces sp. ISL-11]MBT2385671.1 hypothetical protein [Streptomyces sp. ISL-11]
MFGRRAAGAALAAAMCLTWSPTAAQAHTGPEPVVCAGQYRTTWTPGLTLSTRPTRISTTETYSCAEGSGKAVKATGRFEGTLPASCLGVNTSPFREVVRFADGRESVIEYTSNVRARAGAVSLIKLEGTVIKGHAKGGHAFRTAQLLHTDLPTACLSPAGLREGMGLAELYIGPPGEAEPA